MNVTEISRLASLRVVNYDLKIKTFNELKTLNFTEKTLDDLKRVIENSKKDIESVKDILTYLHNIKKHIHTEFASTSDKTGEGIIKEAITSLALSVNKALNHYENVNKTLDYEINKLPSNPDYHLQPSPNFIKEYGTYLKNESESSKKVANLIKGGFWSNFLDSHLHLAEIKVTLENYKKDFNNMPLEKNKLDDRDEAVLRMYSERYIGHILNSPLIIRSTLKNIKKTIYEIEEINNNLYVLSRAEAKIALKWKHLK